MNTAIARRYAKALFELSAKEKSSEGVRDGMEELDRAIRTNPDLMNLCRNPIYRAEEKIKTLGALLARIRGAELLIRFVEYLVRKNRLVHLSEITRIFASLVDEAQGKQSVRVRAARPFSAQQEEGFRKKLERIFDRKVELTLEEDPSLIGGMVILAGSRVYDASLRGRLRELRLEMVKER